MYHYTAIQWLFFFYFYCFFGWCFESTYVSIKSRKLVNRGFMRGPFLPLYGSGAIMMLVVSMPFQDNLVMVYIAGCIGATVLEYVTGVTMEALFKVRYWDYSKNKFNFQGHICLGSSLAWGGLTILMTEVIHKPIEHLVLSIPDSILTPVTLVLTALMFIGASPGSTGGGIKASRFAIACKSFGAEIHHVLHPRAVTVVRLDGKAVEKETITGTRNYIIGSLLILTLVTLLIAVDGFDFTTNFSATLACFSNIGPGLAQVGPMSNFGAYSPFSKILLTITMLTGRLEVFPIVLMLSPRTWRRSGN